MSAWEGVGDIAGQSGAGRLHSHSMRGVGSGEGWTSGGRGCLRVDWRLRLCSPPS